MARVKVVHSDDAVEIVFHGDKRNPEPSTAVIKFPGGHVEVSRCSDGSYWAHTYVEEGAVVDSRFDYVYPTTPNIAPIPSSELIKKIAIRIAS
jgi:hypothetical protein